MNSDVIALVSVIVSGLVAVISGLSQNLLQWSRLKKERTEREVELVNSSTIGVLEKLAVLQAPKYNSKHNELAVDYARFLSSYYAWEQVICSHVGSTQARKDLGDLREKVTVKIERVYADSGETVAQSIRDVAPEVAAGILQLTRLASSKL